MHAAAVDAFSRYAEEVRSHTFPSAEHEFGMDRAPVKLARLY
jgi:ketopantoate hydroxymethyltransferase